MKIGYIGMENPAHGPQTPKLLILKGYLWTMQKT